MGGVRTDDYVRIWIDHSAKETAWERMAPVVDGTGNETTAPFVDERGLRCGVHVDETPVGLWTIDGHVPSPLGSEDQTRWSLENNRASPPHGG